MGMDAYIRALTEDARRGGDLLEQLEAGEECKHRRMPWDPTPDCGCWPTAEAQLSLVPPVRRSNQARRSASAEAKGRVQWLRDAYDQPGMTYQKVADAYYEEFGVVLTFWNVRNMICREGKWMREDTMRRLGIAA